MLPLMIFALSLLAGGPDTYIIADGSANKYILTGGNSPVIEYIPVRPENSSSGMYSGGDPVKKNISPEQFRSLQELIENVMHNKKIRIKDRIKGSVAVSAGKKSYVLDGKADESIKLLEGLKAAIQ